MTVRQHISNKLMSLTKAGLTTFRTSDIQELSYIGKQEFGNFLGSPGTYTREFRRMKSDGVIKVKKLDRKNRQQIWALQNIDPFILVGK